MQNLYFFVAVRTLQNYLMEGSFDNQVEFLETLFESYSRETGKVFDSSLANKWIKGTAKLSPDICRFYRRQKHRQDLIVTLEDVILPSFYDSAMAVRKVYELLIRDVTISEEKKHELCSSYSTESPRDMAVFLADVLVFAMGRPAENRKKAETERSARMEGYEDLFQIVSHFYHNAGEYSNYIYEIIDALCNHTTAVELVAKLLENGVHYPYDVIIDLKTEGLTYNCSEKLSSIKDGQMREASLYEHMRNLFSFSDLTGSQREIMNYLSLVPDSGIAPKTFAEWMKMKDLNAV